jgi:hypothetical protein
METKMKSHKWWLANKQNIKQRIIKNFGLPKNWQGIK